ncbi:hypothetical protein [Auritidibacter ignavus]|uniref:hypothetical protein n=1 Tax=Auritidibacter ignavus TaxID=678932 RepID=UPI00109CF1DF|nr:hypothetical protein [Auritidibacter ignavus]
MTEREEEGSGVALGRAGHLALWAVCALALAGCADGDDEAERAQATPSDTASASQSPSAEPDSDPSLQAIRHALGDQAVTLEGDQARQALIEEERALEEYEVSPASCQTGFDEQLLANTTATLGVVTEGDAEPLSTSTSIIEFESEVEAEDYLTARRQAAEECPTYLVDLDEDIEAEVTTAVSDFSNPELAGEQVEDEPTEDQTATGGDGDESVAPSPTADPAQVGEELQQRATEFDETLLINSTTVVDLDEAQDQADTADAVETPPTPAEEMPSADPQLQPRLEAQTTTTTALGQQNHLVVVVTVDHPVEQSRLVEILTKIVDQLPEIATEQENHAP